MAGKLAWALLALMVAGAYGADDLARQAQIHPLTNMPAPGDISTTFLFPTYPNKKFPAGKLIDVVVGIHNDGSQPYNVSMIMGSLNSPVDFSVHVQNFTSTGYGQVIAPGEELSLLYKFYPDSRLEPREFTVALTVFYSDEKAEKWFSTTFFNQTVDIVEIKKLIDWELIFLILIFAAIFSAIGWLVHSYVVSLGFLKSQKKRKTSKRASGEPVVMSAEDHEEWVKGTPYDSFRKRQQKSSGKK